MFVQLDCAVRVLSTTVFFCFLTSVVPVPVHSVQDKSTDYCEKWNSTLFWFDVSCGRRAGLCLGEKIDRQVCLDSDDVGAKDPFGCKPENHWETNHFWDKERAVRFW